MGIVESASFHAEENTLKVERGDITILIEVNDGGIDSGDDYTTVSDIKRMVIFKGNVIIFETNSIHKKVVIVFGVGIGVANFTVENKKSHRSFEYDFIKSSTRELGDFIK